MPAQPEQLAQDRDVLVGGAAAARLQPPVGAQRRASASNRPERDVGVADVDGQQQRAPSAATCDGMASAVDTARGLQCRPMSVSRPRRRSLRDAGLLRRVRGRGCSRRCGCSTTSSSTPATAGREGPFRQLLRLRRRDDAERARQPVAGDRRRAGHRHHRRLDRRAAGGDPLHVARRRHVLPRPHQPGRDGLLRRRLRRGAVGQPDRRARTTSRRRRSRRR